MRIMIDEDNGPFDINGKLKNWYIYFGTCIMGNIFNDSKNRFEDNTLIKTSKIQEDIIKLKEGDFIHTRNSIYLLGNKGLEHSGRKYPMGVLVK